MTDKHTPGPWRYSGPYMSFQMVLPKPVRDGGGVTIYAGKQKTICSSTWCGPEDRDVAEANARLIAAAPELLASVIELLAPLERASASLVEHGRATDENAEAAFDRAHAAITKATGAA